MLTFQTILENKQITSALAQFASQKKLHIARFLLIFVNVVSDAMYALKPRVR